MVGRLAEVPAVVKLGGVSMCGGTAAIFGGVLIYIFLLFLFHRASLCILGLPHGASLLGHVAASDLSTCER
jgi:uncharacterized membrane protein